MNQDDYYAGYAYPSELQRQAGESQAALYAPQLHEQLQQTQAVLVEQTNPRKVVKEIILRLQGLEEMPDGTIRKWGEPIMNQQGVEKIKYLLESYINQNTILSHLDENQIRKIIITVGNDLVDDLTLNWKLYGIINKNDLDTINDTILINIYNALNRALGQNEKNWLGKITMETLTSGSRIQPPKKEGFWSKLKL